VVQFLTGRVMRVAAQAAVLTAVIGGTVLYARHSTDVTLVLDGVTSVVQTDAGDVRGLLADEGIHVGRRDLVAPDPASPLREGQRVVVRFARPLTVTVDGRPRAYWTTELTVSEALTALHIRSDGARLSTSRSEPLGRAGLQVVLSHPKRVTVVVGGTARDVTTTAASVADLLAEQGLEPGPADQLSALPGSPVVDGLVLALTRIERRLVTVTEPVPPATVRRPAADLPSGQERILDPGRPGTRRTVYEVVLADGHPTGRTALRSVVVTPPAPRVISVGSRPAAATDVGRVPTTDVDGLNWGALARCESGGNPRAVNPAGYYGLYQFSAGTWHAVGGSGLPTAAPPAEQLYRAKLLYRRGGAGQWGCGRHLFD